MYLNFQPVKNEDKKIGSFTSQEIDFIYWNLKEAKDSFFSSVSEGTPFQVNREIKISVLSIKRILKSNGYLEFTGEADYFDVNKIKVKVSGVISFNV